MKVLVTGASGLLGFELCKRLKERGDTVHAVDNFSRGFEVPYCDMFFNCNLTLSESFNQFDVTYDRIYHYAAINGTNNFYQRPNDVTRINALIDFNVFEFCKSMTSNPLVVYAGSSEVVADNTSEPLPEETDIFIKNITNPRWSYRLVKIMSENYLVNSGMNYLICRYFNVYGCNSKEGHFVADQVNKILNDNYSIIGANETRSFCHVYDAIDATVYCADNHTHDIVNIGNDEEINIKEAAKNIAKSLGTDVSSINWEYKNSRSGSTPRRLPDISKLKKIYHDYTPMSFSKGIQKSFNK